jgi:tetrapyrrole methylase family protein/MazG family protein
VTGPRIDVVGLGPAGPDLLTAGTIALIERAATVVLRTRRHPAADRFPLADSFDHHYETGETFEDVYASMVADLVAAASEGSGPVVFAVPGSPNVAEHSVTLLRAHPAVVDGRITVVVHPSVSFLDLAFARLGVDPVATSARMVDGETFAVDAAGQPGPLLVAQCWNTRVLSDIKLSVETDPDQPVTVLHHLGLDDEVVMEVPWHELDRAVVPDHLTSLWIPHLDAPVAAELVRLDELVHILRQRCPWDRAQTHGSLSRHLLEESYEVLEAIDAVAALDGDGAAAARDGAGVADDQAAVAHLEEELGDLLFQVYFHATLAAEAGRFTLADVARGVHDKLVSRHPHVFGGAEADTPDEVATSWELRKLTEKNRASVTEGIPAALPSLALTAKLQRKALAVGMVLPSVADEAVAVAERVARLVPAGAPSGVADGEGGGTGDAAAVGDLLFAVVNLARGLGVDPETALRVRAAGFRTAIDDVGPPGPTPAGRDPVS